LKADSETSAKALGNSKAVADKHYIKPTTVLPDVRKGRIPTAARASGIPTRALR